MFKVEKERAIFILKKEYDNTIFILAKGEGSLMTYSQTVATISGEEVKARPRDIILVKNIQKGLDYVIDKLLDNKFEFNKDSLCYINRLVASDDNFDNLGGFRKNKIRIRGSKNTGANLNNIEFDFYELLNSYSLTEKNGISEMKLCADLAKKQFFGDGNKRTAQLMMNGLLVLNGYAPFVLNYREEKVVDALLDYYDNNNIENLLEIMLNEQKETMLSYSNNSEIEKIELEYENDIKLLNISINDKWKKNNEITNNSLEK